MMNERWFSCSLVISYHKNMQKPTVLVVDWIRPGWLSGSAFGPGSPTALGVTSSQGFPKLKGAARWKETTGAPGHRPGTQRPTFLPSYLCHFISIWHYDYYIYFYIYIWYYYGIMVIIYHYMVVYGLGATPLRSPVIDGVRHHSLCMSHMSHVAWGPGKANLQTVLFPRPGLGMFRKTPRGKLGWRSPILSSDGLTTSKSCRQDWLRTIF